MKNKMKKKMGKKKENKNKKNNICKIIKIKIRYQ
jgi:hypothetical protein